jgi:hypothetical protein
VPRRRALIHAQSPAQSPAQSRVQSHDLIRAAPVLLDRPPGSGNREHVTVFRARNPSGYPLPALKLAGHSLECREIVSG